MAKDKEDAAIIIINHMKWERPALWLMAWRMEPISSLRLHTLIIHSAKHTCSQLHTHTVNHTERLNQRKLKNIHGKVHTTSWVETVIKILAESIKNNFALICKCINLLL